MLLDRAMTEHNIVGPVRQVIPSIEHKRASEMGFFFTFISVPGSSHSPQRLKSGYRRTCPIGVKVNLHSYFVVLLLARQDNLLSYSVDAE